MSQQEASLPTCILLSHRLHLTRYPQATGATTKATHCILAGSFALTGTRCLTAAQVTSQEGWGLAPVVQHACAGSPINFAPRWISRLRPHPCTFLTRCRWGCSHCLKCTKVFLSCEVLERAPFWLSPHFFHGIANISE